MSIDETPTLRRRQLLATTGAATLAALLPRLAQAALTYPTRPLRVVVPYPPGGPTDIVGRIVANRLSELSRQPVTIDNRAGASGMIGADLVAKGTPDGALLLVNVSGHLVNPSLYTKMPHDPLKDFTPVTNLASTPIQLVVRADSPVQTLADLVALVRSQPGKHTFASSSVGTPGHLTGEMFKVAAQLDAIHVPYKGSAPALTDVVGGQVTYMCDSMPSSIAMVKGGRLRALAVTSPQRAKALPQVPTFAEAGYPDINLSTWYGMWAPPGTPAAIIQQANAAVAQVLAEPDTRAKLEAALLDGVGDSPEHFAAYCQSEAKRYASIVKTAGIKME